MSIRVDIANQVRQTTVLSWRPLLPLFEAVMNSFQAINEARLRPGIVGHIEVEVIRANELGVDEPSFEGFRIVDNGIGLDDKNYDSFNTAFSSHKLSRGGKGLGRFTWLKAFDHVKLNSRFQDGDRIYIRDFVFDENYDVDDKRGLPMLVINGNAGTTVELVKLRDQYRAQCPRTTDAFIQKLIEHFMLVLLDDHCPSLSVVDLGLRYNINEIFSKDYKSAASQYSFEIDGHEFALHGFRIPNLRATNHKLIYAADQRAVLSDKLAEYLPNLSSRLEDGDGKSFFYLGVIQSSYLTDHVNANRTDFEFGDIEDAELELPLSDHRLIPKSEIRNSALPLIQQDLKEIVDAINSAKLDQVKRYVRENAPQYRILLKASEKFLDKLSPSPSKTEMETILHRELFARETELKRESSRIVREAAKITDYDTYYRKFTAFLDEYNDLGVSALAQYVEHRKIILDLLEKAINLPENKKHFPLEKVVHHLVFPMQSTSDDIPSHEQNLWLLDERLTFHTYVSSDKKNKSISLLETIDEQRGDIVIFDEKIIFSDERPNEAHPLNSIIVIEFKQPGRAKYRPDENPVLQAAKVIKAIREGGYKHKGRSLPVSNAKIPATILVVADLTPKLREILIDFSATPTPDQQGYYGYHPNYEVYYEVMDYTKMLSDAKKRNRIFFDKLNLVDNH